MKNTIKYVGLLLIILTTLSCSNSKKSGCYTFTHEEVNVDERTDFAEARYKVYKRDESVSED